MPRDAMYTLLRVPALRRQLPRSVRRELHRMFPGQVPASEVEPVLSDPRLRGALLDEGHTLTTRSWRAPAAEVEPLRLRRGDLLFFTLARNRGAAAFQRVPIASLTYRVTNISAPDAENFVTVALTPAEHVFDAALVRQELHL